MTFSFRTCPVCKRLTLNQRCDHPNCPTRNGDTPTHPAATDTDRMTSAVDASDRDEETA